MFRLRRKPVRLDVAPRDFWRSFALPARRDVALGRLRRLYRRPKARMPR